MIWRRIRDFLATYLLAKEYNAQVEGFKGQIQIGS